MKFYLLVALSMCQPAVAQDAPSPAAVTLGSGTHRYAFDPAWGKRADGKDLGNTHGCVVVDGQGRIYFNTDTEDAVMVFDADGKQLTSWGKDWKGGLHGMTLVREGDEEFLYLAHTARHEVAKTTLLGEVLWTLGAPKEAGVYDESKRFLPTSVAVGDNGDVYVADGYGQSWIHQFTKEREYLRSFGGPGKEPGKLRTPHGISIDRRGKEPVLVVCDRENRRLQLFDLEGKHLRVIDGDVRRPCNVAIMGDDAVVADLCGRVTVFDQDWKVIAHLGDNPDQTQWANNGVPKAKWQAGVFISPHGAAWDAAGNLYVMDWLAAGRVSKLRRIE
jgi:sugar lactone lactonase YvrE